MPATIGRREYGQSCCSQGSPVVSWLVGSWPCSKNQKGETSKEKLNGKEITKQTFPLTLLLGLAHLPIYSFIYSQKHLFSTYYIMLGSMLGTETSVHISWWGWQKVQKITVWQITWETRKTMGDQGKALTVGWVEQRWSERRRWLEGQVWSDHE